MNSFYGERNGRQECTQKSSRFTLQRYVLYALICVVAVSFLTQKHNNLEFSRPFVRKKKYKARYGTELVWSRHMASVASLDTLPLPGLECLSLQVGAAPTWQRFMPGIHDLQGRQACACPARHPCPGR